MEQGNLYILGLQLSKWSSCLVDTKPYVRTLELHNTRHDHMCQRKWKERQEDQEFKIMLSQAELHKTPSRGSERGEEKEGGGGRVQEDSKNVIITIKFKDDKNVLLNTCNNIF